MEGTSSGRSPSVVVRFQVPLGGGGILDAFCLAQELDVRPGDTHPAVVVAFVDDVELDHPPCW